jgi:hypothetical protein
MERRSERRNETVMMGKIDSIISSLANQDKAIAVIQTKSEATEQHLSKLNSKVALQEGRQQATDAAVSLNTQSIKILLDAKQQEQEEKKTEGTFWKDSLIWLVRGIIILFLILFYKLLVSSGLISNFLGK